MQWGVSEEGGLVVGGPDFVAPRYVVQATTTDTGIGQREPAICTPRQHPREHGPTIIGNATAAAGSHAVAPREEDPARAPVGQPGQRKVAELLFDALDVPDVALACDLGEAEKFGARLVGMHHGAQRAAWRRPLAG